MGGRTRQRRRRQISGRAGVTQTSHRRGEHTSRLHHEHALHHHRAVTGKRAEKRGSSLFSVGQQARRATLRLNGRAAATRPVVTAPALARSGSERFTVGQTPFASPTGSSEDQIWILPAETEKRGEAAEIGGSSAHLKRTCPASDARCAQLMNARDELLDFMVRQISGTALAGFQASDSARQRVWTLIAKEKETGLLPEEKLELDDSLKLEHLLVLAKAKARLAGGHA